MARAPVSKTGGWGFESLHSCHTKKNIVSDQLVKPPIVKPFLKV